MTDKLNIDDLKRRMEGAISSFSHDLSGLRTGRASANMIDHVTVDAYGSKTPIKIMYNNDTKSKNMKSFSS